MDAYVWGSALHSVAAYAKNRFRTPEEVEKELAELKKRIDDHFEYELNDRTMHSLNGLIIWHEAGIKNLESDIKALESVSQKVQGSTDWIILNALFTARLERDKKLIEEAKELLAQYLEKAKTYTFEVRGRELREELQEMKEIAAPSEDPKES